MWQQQGWSVMLLAILVMVLAPVTARPCSMGTLVPTTPHENAVAVTGRVIEHVSIQASAEDWSSGHDGRIWGLVVRVEDVAWNPTGHAIIEVFPLGYDPACRFSGYGREDLDKYPPGTRIWLVGSASKEVPADSGGAPRFLLWGYERWGPYSEELQAWDRDRFDFAGFLEVARHYGSDLDPDFAFYAYYRGLASRESPHQMARRSFPPRSPIFSTAFAGQGWTPEAAYVCRDARCQRMPYRPISLSSGAR